MDESGKVIERLTELANVEIAEHSQVFFKTGPGEYAEGDKFLGIRVPVLRKLVKEFKTVSLSTLYHCLSNEYHEVRLFALLSLVERYKKSPPGQQQAIYDNYLQHIEYINNWDLVDSSAPHIVGAFLFDKERTPLYQLVKSTNIWSRRIAILSTHYFIKRDNFQDCLHLSELLLHDSHDLIHKAVGWMLREIGKRNKFREIDFLKKHYHKMPRTMLRYAIEHFSEPERQGYLKGTV